MAVARGGYRDREASLGDVAGFQTVNAIDRTEEVIVVSHDYGFLTGVWTKRMLLGRSVAQSLRMFEQLAAQQGEIPGSSHIMLLASARRQAMDGVENGAGHAQLFSPAVHQLDKSLGAAGHFLSNRNRSIVGRLYHQRV